MTTQLGSPTGKGYRLTRLPSQGTRVCIVSESRTDPLPHIVRHSPAGYEWGYGGSGPADLARSILTDAVGSEIADVWYQAFKWEVIVRVPYSGGMITMEQIHQFLKDKGVCIP